MLVLKRPLGKWVEIRHRSGDVLRVWVRSLDHQGGYCSLIFDDRDQNFVIERSERLNAESKRDV